MNKQNTKLKKFFNNKHVGNKNKNINNLYRIINIIKEVNVDKYN